VKGRKGGDLEDHLTAGSQRHSDAGGGTRGGGKGEGLGGAEVSEPEKAAERTFETRKERVGLEPGKGEVAEKKGVRDFSYIK